VSDQRPEEKALAAAVSRTLTAREKLADAEKQLTHALAACRAAGLPDERIRRMTRKLNLDTSPRGSSVRPGV
jgi:hypothetical protein